jgi:competence protein ComGC
MKMQTKLKVENFLNRIQQNFTLMEWLVMFLVIYLLGNALVNWIIK